jgi:hypothetical protein
MKTNDLLTVTTVAVGTAALTVLTLWPSTLDAGNDSQVPAQIAKPKLVSRGVEMTLVTADGKVPKAGDVPVLELTAVSFTNVSTRVSARVTMNISSPADIFSRTVRMPATVWVDNREFTVPAGEKKTLRLLCGTNLPPNRFISVSLQDAHDMEIPPAKSFLPLLSTGASGRSAGPAIIALSFSTGTNTTTPALVTIR